MQFNVGANVVAILAILREFMHFLVYVLFTGLNSAIVSLN